MFNDLSLNNDIFLLRSGLIPSVMVVIGQCFPNRTFLIQVIMGLRATLFSTCLTWLRTALSLTLQHLQFAPDRHAT